MKTESENSPIKTDALPDSTADQAATRLQPSRPLIYLGWIVLCVLVAFALRTWRLDLQSLWYDEGVTVDIARRTLPDLTRWTAQDIQPPLYYYVVSAWGKVLQGLGSRAPGLPEIATLAPTQQTLPFLWGGAWSEWSVRFVSAFFGTLLVPLMAGLTMRLTRQRVAGGIAAWFTAIHPLFFYYSQEARMYAMLTFLGVLAGYILFGGFSATKLGSSIEDTDKFTGVRWWLYILVATGAVYTHYFAFFLLAALGLAYLLPPQQKDAPPLPQANDAEPSKGESRLGALVSANITILILYIPWFFALFTQLRGDSSYWQGDFKLYEAIRKIAVSFVGGETVREQIGLWLLIPMGLLTVFSIIALAWPKKQPLDRPATRPLSIALIWWLLPTALILLLALVIPKFNPRYVMLSLPGLILLWSAGLSRIQAGRIQMGRIQAGRIQTTIAAILLLLTSSLFLYADRNYFTDPEFTKTQWRPLAQYVRKRLPPEDAVVLTSGHTWPIWNYYAPNIPPVSIPRLRILDVNSVLDYPTAGSLLGNALVGKQGAWLVSWQDEVVDPMDVVPLYLERAGSEVPSERDYWDISLRRFEALDGSQLQPNLGMPISINYGNQLVLQGFDTHSTGELLLYWQRHPDYEPPASELDLRLAGQLRTPEGLVYATFEDEPLTMEEWPTDQWRPEQLVVSKVAPTSWAGYGAMPGVYGLQFGLYDPAGDLGGVDIFNDEGQPMGKQRLIPVTLPVATGGPTVESADFGIELQPGIYANMGVGLATHNGEQPESVAVEAGQSLPVAVEWLVEDAIAQSANQGDMALQFMWQNRAKEIVAQERLLVAPGFPLEEWPANQKLRTLHRLQTDAALTDGDYALLVAKADPDAENAEGETLLSGNSTGEPIAQIQVLPSTRSFEVPPLGQTINVEFGGQIALRGLLESVELPQNSAAEGQVALSLVWQAIDVPQNDYTVSIQLVDGENTPIRQVDLALPSGSSSWLTEQVELQRIELTVPSGLADSKIIAVVYDANGENFPRLLRPDGTDFVIIVE